MNEYERQWLKDKKDLEIEKESYNYTKNAVKQFTKRAPSQPIVISRRLNLRPKSNINRNDGTLAV